MFDQEAKKCAKVTLVAKREKAQSLNKTRKKLRKTKDNNRLLNW